MRIGFIGAGAMGWPMVIRLRDTGHDVTVLARSEDSTAKLKDAGLPAAASIAEACTGAEAVIICVFSDEQVREVTLGAGGVIESAAPGTTVIIHTTGSPATAEAVGAAGAAKQIAVLDSPVSGGPHDIAAGAITLYVGGPGETLEAVRPALEAYGSPILHLGPLGSGQRIKLVNNALFSANLGLAADAFRLGQQLGLSMEAIAAGLSNGSGGRPVVGIVAATGGRPADTVGKFVGKDVKVVQEVAPALGADLGVMGEVLAAPFVRKNVLGVE